jgi:hypothetical protein
MLKTLNGSDSASTSTTDPLLLLDLVTPTSRATTLSVEHMSLVLGLVTAELAQIPLQDEVIRASGVGKVPVSVCDGCLDRNFNGISFTAGEPLRAPQPGFGPRNSEARVVRIESARPPQQHNTCPTGMRSVQRANGRVRSDTCLWI